MIPRRPIFGKISREKKDDENAYSAPFKIENSYRFSKSTGRKSKLEEMIDNDKNKR